MWADLFQIQIPILEKVLRTVGVYVGMAILLRLAGKRDLAELNTFDLVVMLLLSNVVQNSIIGNDNSLLGGLLGAAVLLAVNAIIVRLAARYTWIAHLFEGKPTDLVRQRQDRRQPASARPAARRCRGRAAQAGRGHREGGPAGHARTRRQHRGQPQGRGAGRHRRRT